MVKLKDKVKKAIASKYFKSALLVTGICILYSTNVFAADTSDNPFIQPTIDLLDKFKNWILALGGGLTVLVCAKDGMGYQAATASEKEEKVRNIRNHLAWGAGITIIVWLAAYIFTYYAAVKV